MLLLVECAWGAGRGTVRIKVPVLVSDLDLECKLWIKLRLAPMCPWVGTLSLAFVGPPTIKVQLAPYARIRLMRIPVLQVRIRWRLLLAGRLNVMLRVVFIYFIYLLFYLLFL